MKKALILHGTDGNSQENWFPWLKAQLEKDGYQVWCPDLPHAEKPNCERYNSFIIENNDFDIDGETILIGHSSGAVAILGLLEALPETIKVQACYLVGSFTNDLGWDALQDLFLKPFNFDLIKRKSRLWYFIHSDNDPFCPLTQAQELHDKIGGDLLVLPGQQHCSVSTAGDSYRQFPYLLHLILGDTFTASDVLDIYAAMEREAVVLWLDGGWGVDALLEKQTRAHGDIDVVIQQKDVEKLVRYLGEQGYTEIDRSDANTYNFIMGNTHAQFVDFHVIELDEDGNGLYGPKTAGAMYPESALMGKGTILGKQVNCISPEGVVKFHSGYELRDKDFHDVLAICEKFGIEVPSEYKSK